MTLTRNPPFDLLVGFALTVGLLGAMAWSNSRAFAYMGEMSASMAHTNGVVTGLNQLRSLTLGMQLSARGFVLTGVPAFLEPFEKGVGTVNGRLRSLCALTRDSPLQRTDCDALASLIARHVAVAQSHVDLRRNVGFRAAQEQESSSVGPDLARQIRAVIDRMESRELALQAQQSAAINGRAMSAAVTTFIGGGFAFALFSVVFLIAVREQLKRVRSEKQLTDTMGELEKFRTALDEHAILLITDSRGRITNVNDKFCAISQYTREELLGQDTRLMNSGHHPKAFMHELWRTIESGETWHGDIKNRAKDGTFYWVATTIVPFVNRQDASVQYFSIRANITTRKEAEEQIAQLNTNLQVRAVELAAANKELESFSYSVSHDLRAPLRSIDGFSQILLEDHGDQLDNEGKNALQRVRKAAERMGHLIDALLALSGVSRSVVRADRVDLSALAATLAAGLRQAHPDRQAEFVIAQGHVVTGDKVLLRAALDNLLGNALKFTQRRAAARIEFGCLDQDTQAVYFVRDNGVGFDMAYVGKLFGAFQRLHRQTDFDGTGIGLATVQRIIHRHGGRVWAEGEVDQGATFYFTLHDQAGRGDTTS